MNDELDDFLKGGGGGEAEADGSFKDDSSDPFAQAEPKAEEPKAEADGKPVPFHKDPKVQRYIQKEVGRITSSLKPSEAAKVSEGGEEADEILARIIGNDTPEKVAAIKDFKRYLSSIEEKGAQRAISKIQAERKEASDRERQATEALESGLESIEEAYGVDMTSSTPSAKRLRSGFTEFLKKVSPKDADGNVSHLPDLAETFAVYQEVERAKAPPNSKAKQIAGRSMSRSADASNAAKPTDNSWKAVDKAFSGMTG